MPSKYRSKKVEYDGHIFHSKRECARYMELSEMEKAGEISDLQLQVKFELIPAQRENGKVVERAITYIADFTYLQNGNFIVEDVKPKGRDGKIPQFYKATAAYGAYTIKRKLMRYMKNIEIHEV